MPSSSGRALPSKWDDAERWISSPGLGNGNSRIPLVQSRRRTKSKSDPLGPSWLAFCGSSSPVLSAVIDCLCFVREIPGKRFPSVMKEAENHVRGMLSRIWDCLMNGDESNTYTIKDANTEGINGGTSRRDAATQMLSEGISSSSPIQRSSFSSLSSHMKIRDVQMKLEKKRSSSMDKIMKKLRRVQLKAEKKRRSLSETHCNEISRYVVPRWLSCRNILIS
ncbi:hypothetical protein Ancab_025989 [Ancistrocladus abbreviatus]